MLLVTQSAKTCDSEWNKNYWREREREKCKINANDRDYQRNNCVGLMRFMKDFPSHSGLLR